MNLQKNDIENEEVFKLLLMLTRVACDSRCQHDDASTHARFQRGGNNLNSLGGNVNVSLDTELETLAGF